MTINIDELTDQIIEAIHCNVQLYNEYGNDDNRLVLTQMQPHIERAVREYTNNGANGK